MSNKETIEEKPEPEQDSGDEGEEAATVKSDEEGGIVVNLPEKKSRKDRRAERGRDRYEDLANEARLAREEATRARRDADEAREQAYRARQEVFQRPQQQTQADPFRQQLDSIRSEQESIQLAFRTGALTDQSEVERLKKRFYDLEERREELRYDKLKSELSQQVPQRREGEDEERVLRAEFPEVVSHQQATRYAIGLYNQMVAEGKPATLATSKEAMRKAGERFGLYTASAPQVSAAQQQKYGGVPAQAGARAASTEIRLTKDQQKMARSLYPGDDEDQAYAKWAAMYQKAEKKSEATD